MTAMSYRKFLLAMLRLQGLGVGGFSQELLAQVNQYCALWLDGAPGRGR
jgi:hypothetical protein